MITREEKLAYLKRYRESNAERISQQKKDWYEKNKDAEKEKRRAYYQRNKEQSKLRAKAWADNNRAKRLEINKRWRESNVDMTHFYRAVRRARLVDARHEPYSRMDVYLSYNGNCHLCGEFISLDQKYPAPHSFVIDHVVPLSKGGDDMKSNVAPAHNICNLKKGDRL